VRPFRILLADDHEVVRLGLRGLIQSQKGWKVCGESSTGKETLEKVKELKPELAIVDISMPDMDGLEAIHHILNIAPETKVLIFTMHESDEVTNAVAKAGAHGYVVKSEARNQLLTAIRSIQNNEDFLSPRATKLVLENIRRAKTIERISTANPTALTKREQEVTRLLVEAKANKEIAATLGMTVRTVETHRARIMRKLGVHSLAELVRHFLHKQQRLSGLSSRLKR